MFTETCSYAADKTFFYSDVDKNSLERENASTEGNERESRVAGWEFFVKVYRGKNSASSHIDREAWVVVGDGYGVMNGLPVEASSGCRLRPSEDEHLSRESRQQEFVSLKE